MDWYYVRGQERVGPLDDEAFQRCVSEAVVSPSTLVWNSTLTDWQPYGRLTGDVAEEAASRDSSGVMATCVECGVAHPVSAMLSYEGAPICSNCKTVYFQRLLQGTPRPGGVEYGGFWRRFVAKVIDYGLLGAFLVPAQTLLTLSLDANSIFHMLLSIALGLANFAITLFYETYMVGAWGATLGKMALGLRIVMADGSKVSYGRALGRAFAEIVSGMILYVGYIMAGFDPERRTLHDHMCNTRVIRP